MGHHSDHHRRAPGTRARLTPIEEMPVLPGGYAGAILLALAPALWRRHMDCRVERWMAGPQDTSAREGSSRGAAKAIT
jgi:alkane 1-monooxygenase